jgi:hypothetical protein
MKNTGITLPSVNKVGAHCQKTGGGHPQKIFRRFAPEKVPPSIIAKLLPPPLVHALNNGSGAI